MPDTPEAHYACPDCGSIDLSIRGEGLKAPDGGSLAKAECPNCAWAGGLSDTVGFATTENVWTVERVGEVLLRVSAKHAAGPMVQVLEFTGLIPKTLEKAPPAEENQGRNWSEEELNNHNELAQIIRDRVMRRTFEAFIVAAFEEAAHCNKLYAIEMDMPQHELLRDEALDSHDIGTLREAPRVFGGDVVDLEDARKKRGQEEAGG